MDTSNTTNTAKKSSRKGLKMESSTKLQSLAISEHSSVMGTPKAIREWLMSSQQDSPVSHSQLLVNELERMTKEICGGKRTWLYAELDQNYVYWKTPQDSLLPDTLEQLLNIWHMPAIMREGQYWAHQMSEQIIKEKGSGLSHGIQKLPTPRACRAMAARLTPAIANHTKNNLETIIAQEHGGKNNVLNPEFVEWMMGFPIGWTDLKPLEMDKFLQWLEQHGES